MESVAWIAERKDVLSGLFFMLTIWAYVRYTRGPFSLGRYGLVLFLFVLGLLSKSMLVTLPFVLLLLDGWPLGRFGGSSGKPVAIRHLILEKVPLLLLSVLFCVITLLVQEGAMHSQASLSVPWPWRVGNAAVVYVVYIGQMFYPVDLAVFYPHPGEELALWKIGGSFLLLLGITGWVIVQTRKRPFLLTGWFWYLGMLIPVIGILQVGNQAHADRYTYLP